MMFFKGSSISELYPQILSCVLEHGKPVSPRGIATWEISPVAFELTEPTQCVVLQKARRLNYAFVIAERLALLSGTADPDMLCFYVDRLRDFVNESTGCFDGAYGPRVRPQLDFVYDELLRDASSRRAVVSIFDTSDQRPSLDVPCTLSLQFLIREHRLDLIVSMRSSDLFLGVPYDVAQFAFLQAVVAAWLGLRLGRYIQWSTSAHVYQHDLHQVRKIIDNPRDYVSTDLGREVLLSYRDTFAQVSRLAKLERDLRARHSCAELIEAIDHLASPFRGYATILHDHVDRKKPELALAYQ